MITVPALTDERGIIVPEVQLSSDVVYKHGDRLLSAAEWYELRSPAGIPTLAELHHAYFSKDGQGEWLCPDYREAVQNSRGKGEYTSTFLRDGREIIIRPDRIFKHDKDGWIAEGGIVMDYDCPVDGWVTEYDPVTGMPVKTGSVDKSKETFDKDVAYFCADRYDLSPVFRTYNFKNAGPFCVNARCPLSDTNEFIALRHCNRSNQQPDAQSDSNDLSHLATLRKIAEEHIIIYVASERDSEKLRLILEDYDGNPESVMEKLRISK